jgi:Xaa-Pro aminopeptidase
MMRDGDPSVPSYPQWILSRLDAGSRVGVDFSTISLASARGLTSLFKEKAVSLEPIGDLLDGVWTDRPDRPAEPVYPLDLKFTGTSRGDKLGLLRRSMKEAGAKALFISALDEIAWILNLRGSDIYYNPVFFSFLLIEEESAVLFAGEGALSVELTALLAEEGIRLLPYESAAAALKDIRDPLMLDPQTTSLELRTMISRETPVIEAKSPAVMLKALKNEVEIEGIREALVKDGIALTRFWMRLERIIERGGASELSLGNLLAEERSRMPGFAGESFSPILGFREHGAVIHYSADEASSLPVSGRGLLLVDSGGHYLEGTTDITRVFAVGEPTDEERHDYTMVLKAHIALGSATFPAGTPGMRLDTIARKPLWDAGLNYDHGTGHGVGAFLNVHEGPQSISTRLITVPMEPGMLCSNEPGLYREGKHGVRIENLILTVERFETPFGRFYGFETLTPFPFESGLINTALLTAAERAWVDRYHAWVFQLLSPGLEKEERAFLAVKTEALA